MRAFIIQRLLQALAVMLVISALVFIGVYAVGNPIDVMISPDATQQIREQAIQRLRLRPAAVAAILHVPANALPTGDFGRSFVYNTPVLGLILSRLPATLEITLAAVIGATLLGVPLGMYAGYRPDSVLAKSIMALSVLGFSVPDVLDRTRADLHVRRRAGRLPAGGRGETVSVLGVEWSFFTLNGLTHMLLPSLNLALFKLALMIRLARAGTREVMLTDTVRFARAAGESEWTILRRHVLQLIAIPLVTVFGLEFGSTLAFAVVTETIFSWPGVGKLIIDSIATPRSAGDGRLSDARRAGVHHDQPDGGHRVRRARSASACPQDVMSTAGPSQGARPSSITEGVRDVAQRLAWGGPPMSLVREPWATASPSSASSSSSARARLPSSQLSCSH